MKIQIDPHALERINERGVSQEELYDVLYTGTETPAKQGRFCKSKIYPFNTMRNNKFYRQKKIEVIYTIENDIIIIVTCYAYYGYWENFDANHI